MEVPVNTGYQGRIGVFIAKAAALGFALPAGSTYCADATARVLANEKLAKVVGYTVSGGPATVSIFDNKPIISIAAADASATGTSRTAGRPPTALRRRGPAGPRSRGDRPNRAP